MTAGRKNVDTLSKDWCTPPKYVDAVRQVFGGVIHLDPCSNKWSVVNAKTEWSFPKADGLRLAWNFPTVYVNPPYGADQERGTRISDWLRKCADAFSEHDAEVIALVPVAANTRHWKEYVWKRAASVCFLYDTRLRFLEYGRDGGKGAPMACAAVYWGIHQNRFADAFSPHGAVVDLSNVRIPDGSGGQEADTHRRDRRLSLRWEAMNMNDRIPAEVFPPGEFLADELDARGWTQEEFAKIIRRPTKVVNEIIMGKKAVTPETAREFSAALGTSAQYWLNLQTAYDLWKSPSPETGIITRGAWLRSRFPVRDLIKRGWVEDSENFDVLEQRVFDFYGIANQNQEPELVPHAARRNYREGMSRFQEAWLFRVKQLASAIHAPRYAEQKLRAALPSLELLMTEPEEIRRVPALLTECGVRLVIVEPIPNSQIDGVCFWIDDNQSPVIGLTLKWDYIDRFWFNLRHEIEHVFRGDGRAEIVIDDFESGTLESQDESEKAANEAAAEFCVPQRALADFILRHDPMYSTANFIGFSRIMKRHPGIVAGQLQRKIGRPELFRKKFQVRVRLDHR